jgi:cephalosporin-C deacetylase
MNLAPDIKPTTLISVGLVDTTCPPSTIFATYNHVGTVQKDLAIYPGMGHEELNIYIEKKMRWTANCFAL